MNIVLQRFVISVLLAIIVDSANVTMTSCPSTLHLNNPNETFNVFVGGPNSTGSCEITLAIKSNLFASIQTNYSISATNALNESFKYSRDFNLPAPTAFLNFSIGVNTTTPTLGLIIQALALPDPKSVRKFNTGPGQQAIVRGLSGTSACTFSSPNGVTINAILEYTDTSLSQIFVLDGPFPDGKVVATLYTLRFGQALASSGTSLSLYLGNDFYSITYHVTVIVNDSSNLKEVGKVKAFSISQFTNLQVRMTDLSASMILCGPRFGDYALLSSNITGNSSQLKVYSGSPMPTTTSDRRFLANYSSSDTSTRLPQYFNMPLVTFQLSAGSASMVFSADMFVASVSTWEYISSNTRGFLTSMAYPFQTQAIDYRIVIIRAVNQTQFTFNVRNAPLDNDTTALYIYDYSTGFHNYTFMAGMENKTISMTSNMISVEMYPNHVPNSGVLLDFQTSVPISKTSYCARGIFVAIVMSLWC